MLQKLIAVWIVAITFFVTDFASGQKTAIIHVNEDQSRTVTYELKGYTYEPARAVTDYQGTSYRGFNQRRVLSTLTGGHYRAFVSNWVVELPAPKNPFRTGPPRQPPIQLEIIDIGVIEDGVERSILIERKVSEMSVDDFYKSLIRPRLDPLVENIQWRENWLT